MKENDPIIALATPQGTGAIGVIRISGGDCISLSDSFFVSPSGKKLSKQKGHTIHFGQLQDGQHLLDEVLISIFRAPNSYTGEDTVEISCHGSGYIQREIIQLFLRNGCRTAKAGEFTLRAFLNGKMDLSQAEAVADLIASENRASHDLALQQMRGGFSTEIGELRSQLLNFASLIELELDFSEEDVEFADRDDFKQLLSRIETVLKRLVDSFAMGNVLKTGIPVAIVGAPNVGKSTLLNALLNEEKAIVSDIAGTTRDSIEDELSIGGVGFRFIDTAGIRETQDTIESIGIQRTKEKLEKAQIVLYLIDCGNRQPALDTLTEIAALRSKYPDKKIIAVLNKTDLVNPDQINKVNTSAKDRGLEVALLSAKSGDGLEALKASLLAYIDLGAIGQDRTLVSNSRHFEALQHALEEIGKVKAGFQQNLPADLMAIDIRQALYHLGLITGEIGNDELLGNIFANFCIGK